MRFKLLKYKENNKKICNTFDHNFKSIPLYTCIMRKVSLERYYFVLYDEALTLKTLTLRKCMYMRASGASELRKFSHFHILKLLFPSIFLLVLQILCLRKSETYLISGVK